MSECKKNNAENVNAVSDRWDKIEAEYGKEVRAALYALYNYYEGEKIADWITGLFDPATGGFYYCNSARDTEGFLPDLESTGQSLTVLAEIGAIPTKLVNEILTEDVRRKIVAFVHDRQSPRDGYYYHPQWPQGRENLNTDRYGRDLGHASSILRRVMCDTDGDGIPEVQCPKYCTVDGIKCKLHAGTDESCAFPLIPLSDEAQSSSEPEKKAEATVSQNHPVYTSAEEFLQWLRAYNATVHKDSGRAHNLAALINEITMYGYENVLIDYLDEMQKQLFDEQVGLGETPTGIWQRDINYRAVWGAYKYAYIYNSVGRPINLEYVPYMIDTCLQVIKLPPIKNYAYNDLMNQWSAITAIIANVRRHHGDQVADRLYDKLRANASSLIANSLDKMLPFKMSDGSFCNNVNGYSTPVIYGTPIAVGGLAEGNVNSTHILLCMYLCICSALGCPSVPLCDTSVGHRVAERLALRNKNES